MTTSLVRGTTATSFRRHDIPTRSYRSPLREDQTAATRERILAAAHRLLGTVRPVDLAYAQIAGEAGVSVRTVYRHFPTSNALFLALSDRLLGALVGPEHVDAFASGTAPPLDLRAGKAMLARQFEMMEADPALYRVFFAVPTRSRSGGDEMLAALFGERLAAVAEPQRRLAYALLDLLGSPYAWDVLHANWGAGAGDAYRAALIGMRAVLELAERSPDAFDPDQDPFPIDPESP